MADIQLDPILQEFAELKTKIAELTTRAEELKPVILQSLQKIENPEKLFPTKWGNFTLRQDKIWHYSFTIETLEEQLNIYKREEKATGVATFDTKETLVFSVVKEV